MTYKNNVNISSCLCLSSKKSSSRKIWKNKPQSFLVSRAMNLFLISHFFFYWKSTFFLLYADLLLLYSFLLPWNYYEIEIHFPIRCYWFWKRKDPFTPATTHDVLLCPIIIIIFSFYSFFCCGVNLLWFIRCKKGCNYIILFSRKFLSFLNRIQFNFMNDILLNSFSYFYNIPIWVFKKRSNYSDYERTFMMNADIREFMLDLCIKLFT